MDALIKPLKKKKKMERAKQTFNLVRYELIKKTKKKTK